MALEVAAVGICGTDLHIWSGEYLSVPPVTLGHEICGVVVDVGAEVDPGWLNKRVAVETYYSTCRTCRYCRTGRPNLCLDRMSLGSQVDGGMAPFVVLPETNLHSVPGDLDDAAATLSEPLACVCHSMMGRASSKRVIPSWSSARGHGPAGRTGGAMLWGNGDGEGDQR